LTRHSKSLLRPLKRYGILATLRGERINARPLPLEIKLNIPALTGLRFVAAMMVVIGHGAPLIVGMPALVQFLLPLSGSAMAPFFVLSGFVIWLNYAGSFSDRIDRKTLRGFAVARFARLWPMYFVTLLIALARMMYSTKRAPGAVPGALFFLVGIQGWIPAIGHTMAAFTLPLVAHLWSVSTEIFLYTLFPLVCFPIARLRSLSGVICTALINAAMAVALHYLLLYHNAAVKTIVAPMLSDGDAMGWVGYYSPYPHLFEFLAGCLAGRAYELLRPVVITAKERHVARVLAYFSLVTFLTVILLYQVVSSLGSWFWVAAVFMRTGPILPLSFLIFYAARYPGSMARMLSSKTMVLGGEASYSIYLLHPLVDDVWTQISKLTPASTPTTINFAGLLIFTVALAMATYQSIEVPGRRFLRKFLSS
jgi:peptidoglycan/LPS O-acetylase OafA/YrhL